MEPLTREQLGELSASFLDLADEISHPIVRAAFVGIYETDDGDEGVLIHRTSDDSAANIRMLTDAVVLEHISVIEPDVAA